LITQIVELEIDFGLVYKYSMVSATMRPTISE